MSNKSQTFPYRLAAAQDMSAGFVTAKIPMLFQDRASISVNVLSGAATGDFVLQGRTSFSPPSSGAMNFPNSTGPDFEWTTLSGTTQSAPGAGASIGWDVSDTGFTELRVKFSRTAGTGSCDVWFAAKRSG